MRYLGFPAYERGAWSIRAQQASDGRNWFVIENSKTGISEYPFLADNRITYSQPEQLPRYVKDMYERFMNPKYKTKSASAADYAKTFGNFVNFNQ